MTRIDFEAGERRKLAGSTGPRAFGINVYEHTWRAVLDDGQECEWSINWLTLVEVSGAPDAHS